MSGVKLVAHRGYASAYPENTLLAIKAAVDAGAKFVEFDILLSMDEVPVLFHDRDMSRMTGEVGAVHGYKIEQLLEFSCHEFSRFGYKFAGNRITLLTELVQFAKQNPDVTFFAEVKRQAIERFGVDTVLARILPLLEKIKKQTVVISYDIAALQKVREQTDFSIGAVFDDWSERKRSTIVKLNPQYVFTDIDQLPRFGKIHYGPSRIAVYECTDPDMAMDVNQRGVDLVETFEFGEMYQSLSEIKE